MIKPVSKPPRIENLPTPSKRRRVDGPVTDEFSLTLETVTPIYGGGYRTRNLDDVDIIRVPTIRGHLRFWWRALNGHDRQRFPDYQALADAEKELWGGAHRGDPCRSAVEISVQVLSEGTEDREEIRLFPRQGQPATPGAYALWPARAANVPRRNQAQFRLTVFAPGARLMEVQAAVRAWILFGGYGSRSRRGLGSMRVTDKENAWLPTASADGNVHASICELFGRDIFKTDSAKTACDTALLAGGELWVLKGNSLPNATAAWATALEWLKEFRQGCGGQQGNRAREPGTGKPNPMQPSISNWPEADKIRRLAQGSYSHPPRYNAQPAWPRAGFGLPIIGQFQRNGRGGARYQEPADFRIIWAHGGQEADRLASPLILKALPLAGGRYLPCALWLQRQYPAEGRVIQQRRVGTAYQTVHNSAAPFDRLLGNGDTPLFKPLAAGSIRAAFTQWLNAAGLARKVVGNV